MLSNVTHGDLLTYGLIPEFAGRLPIVTSLETLDKDALMRILTESRNALVKQYQRFFATDKVELVFTQEALEAAAELAMKQKTGARGLRTVVEECLLEVMYEIPSRGHVKKCIIKADTIRQHRSPLLLTQAERPLSLDELRDESA